jgi:hypothetical protein
MFLIFFFFLQCFFCNEQVLNTVNKVLDIAADLKIINAEPIDINLYLTEIEKDIKAKAVLYDFLDTWTGKNKRFDSINMLLCQFSFTGSVDYNFSHKDDVKKLRADYDNLKTILNEYGIKNINFAEYKGKKRDFWGTGKNDDFERFQYNTLWWQIDLVTLAIWQVLMEMKVRNDAARVTGEINNLISSLSNIQNSYQTLCYSADLLVNMVPVNTFPYEENKGDDISKNAIVNMLERYSLEKIKNEIYSDKNISKQIEFLPINDYVDNLKSYEKNPADYACPSDYLIQSKGDKFKKPGLSVSEKIIEGMCDDNSKSKKKKKKK